MEISPELGVVIMLNNYFHDVATAVLASAAVVLWALFRVQEKFPNPEATGFFFAACKKLTLMVRISLAWIVLGGVPRTIFYRDFEWANAAGKGQVPALVVKHVLILVFVIVGGWAWLQLKRRIAELK